MKLARIVLLAAVLLLLPGCWNKVELNDIAIISGTSIDWQDGEWLLSFQMVLPQAISSQMNSEGTAAVQVFSTKGENFRTARSKVFEEMPRTLHISHNQVLVISQEAARKGLAPLLEVYLRNYDTRETVNIFLSKGKARRVLEQLSMLEQIPGTAIKAMSLNEEKYNSSYRQMTTHQLQMDLLGGAQAAVIPGLVVAGSGENTDSMGKLEQTSMKSKVRLHETGLIVGDKLVGWINGEQSKGVMWLTDHINQTTMGFPCEDKQTDRYESSVHIQKAKTKRHVERLDNGKFRIRFDIRAEGTLNEYNCHGDLTKPDEVAVLEQKIANSIKMIATDGWEAVRKHKADVLGFGDLISQHYPRSWKQMRGNWREEFPRIEISLNVKVKLINTGMSNDSFESEQKKAMEGP